MQSTTKLSPNVIQSADCFKSGGSHCEKESDRDSGICVLSYKSSPASLRRARHKKTKKPKNDILKIYTNQRSKLSLCEPSSPIKRFNSEGSVTGNTIRGSCRKLLSKLYSGSSLKEKENAKVQSPVVSKDMTKAQSLSKHELGSHLDECIKVLSCGNTAFLDYSQPRNCSTNRMIETFARVASVVPVENEESGIDTDSYTYSNASLNLSKEEKIRPKPISCREKEYDTNLYSIPFYESCSSLPNHQHSSFTHSSFRTTSQNSSSCDYLKASDDASAIYSVPKKEAEYAIVNKNKKNVKKYLSLPSLQSKLNVFQGEPPVPPKNFLHKSDFALYKTNCTVKKSWKNRVQSVTKSARHALQKAFSTERIYRPEQEEINEITRAVSPPEKRGLKSRLSFRKPKRDKLIDVLPKQSMLSFSPEWNSDQGPSHVWGQLIQLNVDGSQVIELFKPKAKAFGFYIARGQIKKIPGSTGIFVSRMRDEDTQKLLAGLLEVGDEILEVNGICVKHAHISEVNNLMSNSLSILLTVFPFINRKDI